MTMHVLESGAAKVGIDRTLCCGRLVRDLPEGDDVTTNPIYYTCSDSGPAALTAIQCGNARHPQGEYHPASPLAASWEWRLRWRQRLNRRRWGCPCDAVPTS